MGIPGHVIANQIHEQRKIIEQTKLAIDMLQRAFYHNAAEILKDGLKSQEEVLDKMLFTNYDVSTRGV